MRNASVTKKFSDKKYKLYKSRVIVYCVFLAIALIICTFLSFNVVKIETKAPINYKDKGVVDYRVFLKENEFYTEKFLPKGKSYVTSLIDNVDVNYNYIFNIDEVSTVHFDYKVVADLIIENNTNKKELLHKDYTIMDSKKTELKNSSELAINEKFQIDYSYYNQLSNQFRSTLGLDTVSYLKVYLKVKRTTDDSLDYKFENEEINLNEIVIPLSEKAIEITIDSKNNEISNQVKFKEKNNINYINIVIIVLLIILSIIFIRIIVISLKKMKQKRSAYDKYINKILKEYDRLIVEIKTIIDLSKCNILNVSEFTELLDVRDNLKVPINYYCIEKHIKGILYIKSENDVYVLNIDNDSLEKD